MLEISRMSAAECPPLSALLRRLKESGVKVSRLAAMFGCSEDTMYRAIDGAWDDWWADLRHALRTGPGEAGDALLTGLLCGTGRTHARPGDPGERDVNGDGRVDPRDSVDLAIRLACQVSDVMEPLRKAERWRHYSQDVAAELLEELTKARRDVELLMTLVGHLTAVGQQR